MQSSDAWLYACLAATSGVLLHRDSSRRAAGLARRSVPEFLADAVLALPWPRAGSLSGAGRAAADALLAHRVLSTALGGVLILVAAKGATYAAAAAARALRR